MAETIGKLQEKLNDTTLGKEFSEYLGWFNLLPKWILIDKLIDKMSEQGQEHLIKGAIHDTDEQLEKIQAFIDRFTKELKLNENPIE